MQITGNTCPVCGRVFSQSDDVVVCPVCGTPHHRECFSQNGGCANESRHESGFIWTSSVEDPKERERADKYKICPACGEKNAQYEPVCRSCGERLSGERRTVGEQLFPTGAHVGYGYDNANNYSPYQNAYASDAKRIFGADATVDGIPVGEVAEFVQNNSSRYIGKFIAMERKKTKLSWNWSAALFSVFWCFYRKLSAAGAALTAIIMSAYFISFSASPMIYERLRPEIFANYGNIMENLYTQLNNALTTGVPSQELYELCKQLIFSPISLTAIVMFLALCLITAVTFGFFADYIYRKRVIGRINALRSADIDSKTYHFYLLRSGGVSLIGAMLPVLAYFAVIFLSSMSL